jgi:hypothetical protein
MCVRFVINQLLTLISSWPTTASHQEAGIDYHLNALIEETEQAIFYGIESKRYQARSHSPNSSNPRLQPVRRPSQCRLPMSARFSSLVLYITLALLVFSSTTVAAPTLNSHSNSHLIHKRQAIPDKTGQTGNEPAPVRSESPHLPVPPSVTPCVINPIPTTTTTTTTTYNSPPPESTPFIPEPGNEGNANGPPGQLGLNPNPPVRPLALTSSTFSLTPGGVAGIAAGSSVLLCILIGVGVWMWKRRRVDVNEIPIRRSRLVSRLGYRVFGEKPPSRNPSRRSNRDSQESKGSWLDKGIIGRPRPALVENGLLTVPKTAFMDRDEVDERAPWADNFEGSIGRPRPSRPRSAEPLGRLSGMGLGMGYMK